MRSAGLEREGPEVLTRRVPISSEMMCESVVFPQTRRPVEEDVAPGARFFWREASSAIRSLGHQVGLTHVFFELRGSQRGESTLLRRARRPFALTRRSMTMFILPTGSAGTLPAGWPLPPLPLPARATARSTRFSASGVR